MLVVSSAEGSLGRETDLENLSMTVKMTVFQVPRPASDAPLKHTKNPQNHDSCSFNTEPRQ